MREQLVRTVLHPTDLSAASHLAFAQALAIGLLGDTELTILHVGPQREDLVDWSSFPQVRKTLERWGLLRPDSQRSAVFDAFRLRVRKLAVRSHDPVRATVKFLDNDPVDLIVLASGGREGMARLKHPSDAEAMARWSHCKTLFVPPHATRGVVSPRDGSGSLNNILVPIDAAPDCHYAIRFAQRVALALGDEQVVINVLHVGDTQLSVNTPPDDPECKWQRMLRHGEPVEQILAAARELETDLIVMATAGHDGVFDAMRGSTTEQVMRRAPCPLLAVPAT